MSTDVPDAWHEATAEGQTFRYLDSGKGPLVLLFHGFPDGPDSWDATRRRLNAEGFRTVVPFLRGYHPATFSDRGFRARDLRAKTIDLRLERTRVDLEEHVAAVDHRAFVEPHGRNESRDAGPDFHGVDSLEPSGEFIPLGHAAFDDAGDCDLWWRRCRLLRGCSRATGHEGDDSEDRQEQEEDGLPAFAEATADKQVDRVECVCAFHRLQSRARETRKQSGSGRISASRGWRRPGTDVLQRPDYDFRTRRHSSLRAMTSRGQTVR